MALVSYAESDSSDVEESAAPLAKESAEAKKGTSAPPAKLVDRSNPRKIIVNLSSALTEDTANEDASKNETARKRPRLGGGGGQFAGFNDLLPAPKRPARQNMGARSSAVTARKPFSLKTGAEPSFSRDEAPAYSGPGASESTTVSVQESKTEEEVKIQGNPMMFKPLSVARNAAKRRKVVTTRATPVPVAETTASPSQDPVVQGSVSKPTPTPRSNPKINLFSIAKDTGDATGSDILAAADLFDTHAPETGLAPLPSDSLPSADPPTTAATAIETTQDTTTADPQPQSLAAFANDLNLTASQRRQLLGRKGGSHASAHGANIVHFDTDKEYAANAAYLASVSEQELAAQQHNPVRAIAPGKHSLQQLVNSVQSQRDALEESFAAGKRNRKEAGSKYGW